MDQDHYQMLREILARGEDRKRYVLYRGKKLRGAFSGLHDAKLCLDVIHSMIKRFALPLDPKDFTISTRRKEKP